MAQKDFNTRQGIKVDNANTIFVGNTVSNTVINSTAIFLNGTIINSTAFPANANNASYLGGTIAASYQLNSGMASNVAVLTANNANNLGGVLAANYLQNNQSRVLSGNINFTAANTYFNSGVYVGANVVVNTSVIKVGSGTSMTINSASISIGGRFADGFATAAEYASNVPNKILRSEDVYAAAAYVTINDGDPLIWNMALGVNFTVAIAAPRTLANPQNIIPGTSGCLEIVNLNGGGYIGWDSYFKFDQSVAPQPNSWGGGYATLYGWHARHGSKICISRIASGY